MCHRTKMRQQGIATLVVAMLLMVIAATTLLVLGERLSLEQKVNTNEYRAMQAFNAAEAGLEYGLEYLTENKDLIILDVDTNGVIDPYSSAYTQNVILADGSSYSVSFSNPIANNFDLIQITSTGTSSDNTTTRVIRQLTAYSTTSANNIDNPIVSKGEVELEGNAFVSNPQNLTTIKSGDEVEIKGSAETNATNGSQTYSSDKNFIDMDIQQDLLELKNSSETQIFEAYFGAPEANVKSIADYSYTGDGNYSSQLDNKTDALIWIDKAPGEDSLEVTINGNVTIGSPANPVVLFVNGELEIKGNAIIYGMVYATDELELKGTSRVYGAILGVGEEVEVEGNAQVIYNYDYLSRYRKMISEFNKVPGSWIDY